MARSRVGTAAYNKEWGKHCRDLDDVNTRLTLDDLSVDTVERSDLPEDLLDVPRKIIFSRHCVGAVGGWRDADEWLKRLEVMFRAQCQGWKIRSLRQLTGNEREERGEKVGGVANAGEINSVLFKDAARYPYLQVGR